jgi:L-lactate dehydrogenase complex protein LldG
VDGEAQARDALREAIAGVPRDQLLLTGDSYERRAYRVGITPAVALIAETGSAVVDVPDLAAAWSSLAVETHWVCACEDDIHPDLVHFYAQLGNRLGGELDRFQVQITGASRTADVEKIVVVPAHGPKQLRLLLSRDRVYWRSVFAELA